MSDLLFPSWSILAQGANPAPQADGSPFTSLPLLLGVLVMVFYFIVLRPQRREQRDRQSMLTQLKKNDRVVTIGGIYGVVTNVRPEADEITIKVDESSNTRLRVTLSSIARLVGEETATETKSGA